MTNPQNRQRRARPVAENTDLGVYMWQFHDGTYLSDGEGNYLNVAGRKFDLEKMAAIQEVVRHYGIDTETGKVVFMPGLTRATDEEYQEDLDRFKQGLTPYGDFGAHRDGNSGRR